MGWLDFFKVKNELKVEIKEIILSEAYILLEQELNKGNKEVEQIKTRVNEKRKGFIFNLKTQINVLSLIDLKEKREDEKLKSLTLQGLEGYIDQLKKLIDDLEKIDCEAKFHFYIGEINLAFEIFIKYSDRKYQKATILIGKELAQTKEIIKSFFKEIDMIVQESRKIISKTDEIENLQILKESLLKIEEIQGEINNFIFSLEKEKKEFVSKKTEQEKEFSLFKGSDEFKELLKQNERIISETGTLNRSVSMLKEKINLKFLLKKFHGIKKDEELIRNYRNDFLKILEGDEELKIVQLLNGEQKESLGEEIKRIREESLCLKKEKELCKVNVKIDSFEEMLKKIDSEIIEIGKGIEEENKKLGKFNEKGKVLYEEIIQVSEGILDNVKIN